MSRGILLSFLICVFFIAIAIPAFAITTGPDNGDAPSLCEEEVVLSYPSKLNTRLTAEFNERHQDPVLGQYLEAAHYQLASVINDDNVNVILQAIEYEFEKDFDFERFVIMKAQDHRMKVVGKLSGWTLPQPFDSVKTDAEIIVASANFDKLFLKELVDDDTWKPNADALKRVVNTLNHQVHPDLAKRGVKQTVLVVIDARREQDLWGTEFLRLFNGGSFSLNDKLLSRFEKLSADWQKEDVRARFLIRGELGVESSRGRELYVPIYPDIRSQNLRDTPAQYGIAQTRFFPRQVMLRTGLNSSITVNMVPAAR